MGKELKGMTLEELWQLFPIFLVPHNPLWEQIYQKEYDFLKKNLNKHNIKRIEHIGSTAIPQIYAKNIIDILIETNKDADIVKLANDIAKLGYIIMSKDNQRISLNKGYTKEGFAEEVFHLHIRRENDNNELYFRDYLIENPHIAKQYEILKLSLWKQFEHNRDGYTLAKTDFIENINQLAKIEYHNRYN